MAILLPIVVLVLAVIFFILVVSAIGWTTGLVLYLVVCGLIGWAADAIVPGNVPYGILGSVLAGIAGGFLGRLILGGLGPSIFGVHIIPALVGAIIVTFVYSLITRQAVHEDRV